MVMSSTHFSSTSVAPYSIISSIYTDGFVEFVKLPFCAQESGKIIWVTPRSMMHLMLKTRVGPPLALFLMKASLRLPRSFPSYIYSVPSSFFSISFWLTWEREMVTFDSVNLAFYFCHFICRQSLGFSSENHFNSKFLFLYIFYL